MMWPRLSEIPRLVLLVLFALLFLFPFIYMIAFSIKPVDEIFAGSLSLLPESWAGLANFPDALRAAPLLRYLMNGVIVCAGILGFQLLFAVPCAFALAKLRFRGKSVVLGLAILGLLDTYAALIVPFVASVFAVFLFRQYFLTIPDDLLNAARLDGCGEFNVMVRIVLPLITPAATAFGIFSVVSHWNDLFWPLIAIRSPELNTPPLGILAFRSAEALSANLTETPGPLGITVGRWR